MADAPEDEYDCCTIDIVEAGWMPQPFVDTRENLAELLPGSYVWHLWNGWGLTVYCKTKQNEWYSLSGTGDSYSDGDLSQYGPFRLLHRGGGL